jgi:phosphoribosylformimino-5-aminoimidazole carboxamide ribotide isomerase
VELYPAIDLHGGRVVQLRQGDYGSATDYGGDPAAVAASFVEQGARWIHVVDLDGARTGEPVNRAAVEAVVAAAGGARDPPLVGRLAARHPGGVAVGLDARDGEVAVRGWTAGSGVSVLELVERFAGDGVGAFVVTDIGRDGTLAGPDVRGLATVLGATDVPVVASGGVGSLDDLRALSALEAAGRRLVGAIVGTAIHDGRFTVADALAALSAP